MRMDGSGPSSKKKALTILNLPKELRALILAKNGSDDVRGHGKVKRVCRTLRDDALHEDTLTQIDFIKTYTPDGDPCGLVLLKRRCLELRNPSCLLLKAISDYMYTDERTNGFQGIKESVESGNDVAMYCYEVIRRSIDPQLDTESKIPHLRRGVIRSRRRNLMRHVTDRWPPVISEYLYEKLESLEMDIIHTCRCVVYRRWLEWWHEDVKGHGMCEACFWTIEAAVFLRFIPRAFDRWPAPDGGGHLHGGWNFGIEGGNVDHEVPVGDQQNVGGNLWNAAAAVINDGGWGAGGANGGWGNANVANNGGAWGNGGWENAGDGGNPWEQAAAQAGNNVVGGNNQGPWGNGGAAANGGGWGIDGGDDEEIG